MLGKKWNPIALLLIILGSAILACAAAEWGSGKPGHFFRTFRSKPGAPA